LSCETRYCCSASFQPGQAMLHLSLARPTCHQGLSPNCEHTGRLSSAYSLARPGIGRPKHPQTQSFTWQHTWPNVFATGCMELVSEWAPPVLLDTLFLRVLLWLGAPPRSDPCRLRGRIAGHGGRSISRIQGILGGSSCLCPCTNLLVQLQNSSRCSDRSHSFST